MQTCVEKGKTGSKVKTWRWCRHSLFREGRLPACRHCWRRFQSRKKRPQSFCSITSSPFSSQSIQGVAARAGVSDATYIRLAKEWATAGLQEFKRNLIVDLASFF